MLGIRRYLQTAIDLWQGDPRTFVTDILALPGEKALWRSNSQEHALVVSEASLPAKSVIAIAPDCITEGQNKERKLEDCYKAIWDLAYRFNERHLSICPVDPKSIPLDFAASLAMTALRTWLDQAKESKIKRITWILSTKVEYQIYQDALFATFPEE